MTAGLFTTSRYPGSIVGTGVLGRLLGAGTRLSTVFPALPWRGSVPRSQAWGCATGPPMACPPDSRMGRAQAGPGAEQEVRPRAARRPPRQS
jgi:hypothetical protein